MLLFLLPIVAALLWLIQFEGWREGWSSFKDIYKGNFNDEFLLLCAADARPVQPRCHAEVLLAGGSTGRGASSSWSVSVCLSVSCLFLSLSVSLSLSLSLSLSVSLALSVCQCLVCFSLSLSLSVSLSLCLCLSVCLSSLLLSIGDTAQCACCKRQLSSLGPPSHGEGAQICSTPHPLRWGTTDAKIKELLVGAQGYHSISIKGSLFVSMSEYSCACCACLHKASTYLVSAFLTPSTSFSPNFSNSQWWNVY